MALFKTESRIRIVGFFFLLGISALDRAPLVRPGRPQRLLQAEDPWLGRGDGPHPQRARRDPRPQRPRPGAQPPQLLGRLPARRHGQGLQGSLRPFQAPQAQARLHRRGRLQGESDEPDVAKIIHETVLPAPGSARPQGRHQRQAAPETLPHGHARPLSPTWRTSPTATWPSSPSTTSACPAWTCPACAPSASIPSARSPRTSSATSARRRTWTRRRPRSSPTTSPTWTASTTSN